MIFSYSFMVYVCETHPWEAKGSSWGVKHGNLGLEPKGNNGWNQIDNELNGRLRNQHWNQKLE